MVTPNPGRCPPEAVGKRVRVILRNGTRHGDTPVNADSKPGWDAGTTRWSLTAHAFDVAEWDLVA